MIAIDASALIHALIDPDGAPEVEAAFSDRERSVIAPHLIDLEVTQTLRRLVRTKELTAERGHFVLGQMLLLPLERMPHANLIARIWQLRENVTAYDAAYIALAELYQAPLLTRDRKFLSIPGHSAQIVLI